MTVERNGELGEQPRNLPTDVNIFRDEPVYSVRLEISAKEDHGREILTHRNPVTGWYRKKKF